ncbi:LON peptidase N-terminal domain and RING finger protein 1 [Cladobotryum mycophilum]|uniref:LON peptidase N-terminal domain and RING finger protein 1 n=1 Tax=Cladobotryum mycophilum TaxID=491253 RepID=A0ABR0S9U0_9HYPO
MSSNHSELDANGHLPAMAGQNGTSQPPPPSSPPLPPAVSPINTMEGLERATEAEEEGSSPVNSHGQYENKITKGARDIVRLFQCRICSQPFTDAVTLPCGQSVCKKCLPDTYPRQSISYPALSDRQEGFRCPFAGCGKEHVVTDCRVDVILNKVSELARNEMRKKEDDARELEVSTQVVVLDPWAVAGITSLRDEDATPQMVCGSKTVATWALAEDGELNIDAEVSYRDLSPVNTTKNNGGAVSSSSSESESLELDVLQKIQQSARSEMDCQVCYALFLEPLTTGCGHTFCRSCLHRILDHSRYCPICRRPLSISPLLDRDLCPSNSTITNIIETFWVDELAARRAAGLLEHHVNQQQLEVPLFVCTLAFPEMPTFLHVFEPRYRLMVRRALEGNKMFGMVLPRPQLHSGDADFHELGTMLRIANVQFYPDGRSLIETVGVSRFKVLRHGSLDGYAVCSTERVDDMSLEDEEAVEAAEVMPAAGVGLENNNGHAGHQGTDEALKASHNQSANSGREGQADKISVADMQRMSTQHLMDFATSFVDRMGEASVPWLTQRMFRVYGEQPSNPATFPWWFASILPVKDVEKYKLLGTSSVRQRLKICCSWIVEWETSRW